MYKNLTLTLIGIAMFKIGSDIAFVERGYEALGGEIVFLILPHICAAIVRVFRKWWV